MDSASRTYSYALATDTTLVEVDVANVVFNLDGLKLTLLLTLATADTSSLTRLHGYGTLVLVDTRDEDSPTLRTLLAQFDDVTRTSLHTSTTSHTLLFVHLGQTGLRIHVDSVKLASSDTVATAQAAKTAGRLTSTTGVHGSTGAQATVLCNLGTQGTSSVTTYYSHHRLAIGNGHTQQVGHLTHHFLSADRTHQSVEASSIGTLNEGVSQTATSSEATSTAVGTRQLLSNLCNAGVFVDVELLGADKQHEGGNQSDGAQYCYCNQNEIHKVICLLLYKFNVLSYPIMAILSGRPAYRALFGGTTRVCRNMAPAPTVLRGLPTAHCPSAEALLPTRPPV